MKVKKVVVNGQNGGNGYSRSKSITNEEEQITFSWENLVVTTKNTQGIISKMVKGDKGATQRTLVDNSKRKKEEVSLF